MLEHLVQRGYVLGNGMVRDHTFYLAIPKNASTYITNLLSYNSWEHAVIKDTDIHRAFVVLRDPIDRWVSGFAQYVASYILGPQYDSNQFINDLNELSIRLIFDNIVFDDHTTEQVKFVKQLPAVKTTFFVIDQNLKSNIERYLNTELLSSELIDSNRAEDNFHIKNIAKKIRSVVDGNSYLRQKIKRKYSEDYQLIESVCNKTI